MSNKIQSGLVCISSLLMIFGIIIMSIGYSISSMLLVVLGIGTSIIGTISLNLIFCILRYKNRNKYDDQSFIVVNPIIQNGEMSDPIELVEYSPQKKDSTDPINIV